MCPDSPIAAPNESPQMPSYRLRAAAGFFSPVPALMEVVSLFSLD